MAEDKSGVKNALENKGSSDKQENYDHDSFWKDLIVRFFAAVSDKMSNGEFIALCAFGSLQQINGAIYFSRDNM